MRYTSIQISSGTRERLAGLKANRETYDDILNKLLKLVPEGDDEGKYTQAFRMSLLNAELDFRAGRTTPLSEAKKSLGIG